ncbi:MAG: FecR domain-containing protein [Chitinophaga sp.]|uniref:FecR family protein n=1 Tax=Chitinophaga sp. TaxID=1869181 RepID=UPI001B06F643|nr:FecR family protein [Chitinophaga sp.]MBO9728263.1 FecR domain-containing protein [Chitinophaga sp.]
MSELTPEQISLLAEKMLKGTISDEEKVLFENWYNTFPEQEVQWNDETIHTAEELKNRMLLRIKGQKTTVRKWYWAAAVLTLLIAGTTYYYTRQTSMEQLVAQSGMAPKPAIVPGSNKATLLLANGNTITLNDEHDGTLAQQGNTQVIKLNTGQLAFQSGNGKDAGNVAALNTLSTPRGGQYQVTLADGTTVWMNAASRLIFPTSFNGKDRTVKLIGEAYFEIAPNEHQPFILNVNNMQVRVLGTRFNVKAYDDEPMVKTTLLQGMVKVAAKDKEVLLKPGQQAKLNNNGEMNVVAVNVDDVMAWKNGTFSFNDVTIEEVMLQIARWYDVEIIYPEGIPRGLFRGEIDKTADIITVLKILEVSGVKFNVDGRKILVRP